jgi:hypothetical protein
MPSDTHLQFVHFCWRVLPRHSTRAPSEGLPVPSFQVESIRLPSPQGTSTGALPPQRPQKRPNIETLDKVNLERPRQKPPSVSPVSPPTWPPLSQPASPSQRRAPHTDCPTPRYSPATTQRDATECSIRSADEASAPSEDRRPSRSGRGGPTASRSGVLADEVASLDPSGAKPSRPSDHETRSKPRPFDSGIDGPSGRRV